MEQLGSTLNIVVLVLLFATPVVIGAIMFRRGGKLARPIGLVLAVVFIVLLVFVTISLPASET